MKEKKPSLLVILDGWGYSSKKRGNAIYHAHPHYFNEWWQREPKAILQASGKAVGLPAHMMGNSAVGHLTIGAGAVVEQPVTYYLKSIENGTFFENKDIIIHFKKLARSGGALHIIGLLSDGGVHCHEKIIHAFVKLGAQCTIKHIFVHAILDGRDSPPQSAPIFLQRLDHLFAQLKVGILASVHGRFYAMDRDGNWDRTLQSFNVLVDSAQKSSQTWQEVIAHSYAHGITDEFVKPVLLNPQDHIKNGDGVIFANIRADRSRQLPALLLNQQNLKLHFTQNYLPSNQPIPHKHKLPTYAFFMTAIEYHQHLYAEVIYKPPPIEHTLMDILAKAHKTVFIIAESEKYAHVTYFFNGGQDIIRANEERIIIPTRPDKNFAAHPAMAAAKITKAVIESLQKDPKDFYLINYANADMVGHTGNFNATVEAIKVLDEQLHLLEKIVTKIHGTLYITADHGNAEEKTGEFKTSHTTNSVPFLMINQTGKKKLTLKGLADIAPFILQQIVQK